MMQQVYKTLPDDRPIMSINVIEDPEKCPSGFAVVSTFFNTTTIYCIILSRVTMLKIIPVHFRKVISFLIELKILKIIIIIIINIIIVVFTFMQGITITYLKQTMFLGYIVLQLFYIYSLCSCNVISHLKYISYFYISTFCSVRAVPCMAVFCSSLMLCFPGMLLRYCVNDFEMVPFAPVLIGITFVFTFHM